VAEFGLYDHQTGESPRYKRQKQIPIQEKKDVGVRIEKPKDGYSETEKGKHSHEDCLVKSVVFL
jgi:hypothetical protein